MVIMETHVPLPESHEENEEWMAGADTLGHQEAWPSQCEGIGPHGCS